MFYTLRFEVPGLVPDFARFATEAEYKFAASKLVNELHAGRPIRIRVRHGGNTVYSFERK